MSKTENTISPIKQYEIGSIHDFLDIPEDRLDVCLRDFKEWVVMGRSISELIKLSDGKADITQILPRLIWIDDGVVGLSEISIRVAAKTGETESEGGEV